MFCMTKSAPGCHVQSQCGTFCLEPLDHTQNVEGFWENQFVFPRSGHVSIMGSGFPHVLTYMV